MAKKKIRQEVYNYTAIFEPAEEGGYVVYIPALSGCVTEGDTFEGALSNIQEAASLYLEVMKEYREEIPSEKRGIIVAPVQVSA